jgi:hypothetical protein
MASIIIIKFKQGQKQVWHIVSLQALSLDLQDILRVQLRELVDEIEDGEDDAASIGSVHAIRFLDDGYRAA